MIGTIGSYFGKKIIVPPPVKVKIKRPWRERLFSLPWKPLISHNIEYQETVKDDEIFQTPDSFIMNQKTYDRLKKELKNQA